MTRWQGTTIPTGLARQAWATARYAVGRPICGGDLAVGAWCLPGGMDSSCVPDLALERRPAQVQRRAGGPACGASRRWRTTAATHGACSVPAISSSASGNRRASSRRACASPAGPASGERGPDDARVAHRDEDPARRSCRRTRSGSSPRRACHRVAPRPSPHACHGLGCTTAAGSALPAAVRSERRAQPGHARHGPPRLSSSRQVSARSRGAARLRHPDELLRALELRVEHARRVLGERVALGVPRLGAAARSRCAR